jgi:hypothetical protein
VRGDEVLVVVGVSSAVPEGTLVGPRGRWRDVLSGDQRSFGSAEPLARVLGRLGIAVYERLEGAAA